MNQILVSGFKGCGLKRGVFELHELECLKLGSNTTGELEICGKKPWLDIVREKLDEQKASNSSLVYLKVSWFNRIVMRVLGIKPLKATRDRWLIAYVVGPRETQGAVTLEFNSRDWYRVYLYKLPRMIALPLSELNRVGLYMAINASGILVNLFVFILVYTTLYGRIIEEALRNISSISGFEASVLYNFTLNEFVTFRNTGLEYSPRAVLYRLGKFHLASLSSWASQLLMVNTLPTLMGIKPWIAQLIGILVGFVLNFILGYLYTWSRHRMK